ncbi:uncharacterized protein PAC_04244 [Phialocephala subalpina]|uniref:Uncharacterized protein n=1 Tax=Phialocephala subalpina TaxID=576137 RepID=A0A1L7WNL9_9HELO|nr:uncharacterized protein PAC_04244 [Phialocephala subalpina]
MLETPTPKRYWHPEADTTILIQGVVCRAIGDRLTDLDEAEQIAVVEELRNWRATLGSSVRRKTWGQESGPIRVWLGSHRGFDVVGYLIPLLEAHAAAEFRPNTEYNKEKSQALARPGKSCRASAGHIRAWTWVPWKSGKEIARACGVLDILAPLIADLVDADLESQGLQDGVRMQGMAPQSPEDASAAMLAYV